MTAVKITSEQDGAHIHQTRDGHCAHWSLVALRWLQLRARAAQLPREPATPTAKMASSQPRKASGADGVRDAERRSRGYTRSPCRAVLAPQPVSQAAHLV